MIGCEQASLLFIFLFAQYGRLHVHELLRSQDNPVVARKLDQFRVTLLVKLKHFMKEKKSKEKEYHLWEKTQWHL